MFPATLSNSLNLAGQITNKFLPFFVDAFPQCFEGAKLLLNKGISSHFQVSHSLALSSLSPGTYHFGATYVGDKQTGPHEVPND
jgi:hypothetical protein